MPPTGQVLHGWRVYNQSRRRKVFPNRWVEEPRFELSKGQRNIDAHGEDGIDPEIVLARAVTKALEDDIRQATADNKLDLAFRLQVTLDEHKIRREVLENGWAARRLMTKQGAAIFRAPTAEASGKSEV